MSIAASDEPPSLCPLGCYWPCEHRSTATRDSLDHLTMPRPVHDDAGQPLRRCLGCGGTYYSLATHAQEHERLRGLGQIPERFPQRWPVVSPRLVRD